MPKFRITNADGKKYDVTVPDGTSPEQAYTIFQNQQGDAIKAASGPRAGALDTINNAIYDAGGWVTDKASQMGASPEVAGAIGTAANVGTNLIPVEGAAGLARGAASLAAPVGNWASRKLMTMALKPTLEAHESGEAARAVDTFLNSPNRFFPGHNPTIPGITDMSDKVGALGSQVKDIIANSPATISKADVYSRLGDVENKARMTVNPNGALSAIQDVGDQFLSHPLLSGSNDIPIQLAHGIKSATQQSLKDNYGELSGAGTEAQKALARGLREEIAKAEPGAADALKQQSDLINALLVGKRRALMDQNQNFSGLSLLADNGISGMGMLADRWAWLKSMLARGINPGSGMLPATGGRLGSGAAINQGQLQQDPSY